MKETRISKVKGFDGLILGRDLADVFTNGHVYSAKKVGGMILIEDLGEHADTFTNSDVSILVITGRHCLTKKEGDGFLNY